MAEHGWSSLLNATWFCGLPGRNLQNPVRGRECRTIGEAAKETCFDSVNLVSMKILCCIPLNVLSDLSGIRPVQR